MERAERPLDSASGDEFSFEHLDELLILRRAGLAPAIARGRADAAPQLGPAIEVAFGKSLLPPDALMKLEASQLQKQINSVICAPYNVTPAVLGYNDLAVSRIPTDLTQPAWQSFLKRAELSARHAGFAAQVSAGVAGAIAELADNIHSHSENPLSAVAGFRLTPRAFEYAVADAGIGILASLRSASEFRSLTDDLEALQVCIANGVSRFGRNLGRGYGFRAVLLPLRAATGCVRLRSGAAVLTVEGFSHAADKACCKALPRLQGVVVSGRLTSPR